MGRGGWAGRIVSGARAASPEFFFSKKTFSERERRVKYNTTQHGSYGLSVGHCSEMENQKIYTL